MHSFCSVKAASVISLMLLFSLTDANATCVRHIINQSKQPWTFKAFPKRNLFGNNIGNVWFENIACRDPKNGPCTVPPGKVAAIKYTTTASRAEGLITSQDSTNSPVRVASYDGFDCPSLSISRSCIWGANCITPSVNLNDPSKGDFRVSNNSWAWRPRRPYRRPRLRRPELPSGSRNHRRLCSQRLRNRSWREV